MDRRLYQDAYQCQLVRHIPQQLGPEVQNSGSEYQKQRGQGMLICLEKCTSIWVVLYWDTDAGRRYSIKSRLGNLDKRSTYDVCWCGHIAVVCYRRLEDRR